MRFAISIVCAAAVSAAFCAEEAAKADETPLAQIEVTGGGKKAPAILEHATAPEVLRICRSMLPLRPVELNGSIILRNRKGIVQREFDYRLVMRRSREAAQLSVDLLPRGGGDSIATASISRRGNNAPTIQLTRAGAAPVAVGSLLTKVMDTDVTWLDLTFDFLWWTDAAYETEREGESVHGQVCRVILVKPPRPIEGLSAVRLWVDKKIGCLMQAEQVGANGEPIRRLWGTRVKKFDDKWMVSVLEVETLGSRHRTKITVEGLKEL